MKGMERTGVGKIILEEAKGTAGYNVQFLLFFLSFSEYVLSIEPKCDEIFGLFGTAGYVRTQVPTCR